MTRIASILASLLLAPSCALPQETTDKSRGFADAVKQAKVTLVDAVQKANAVLSGTVVQAALQPTTKAQTKVAYQVLVLHEGKLFAIPVDAVGGAVGKPKELADEDDDDDEQGGKQDKESTMPKEKPTAAGPIVTGTKLDFEDVATGSLPAGWVAAETAGAGRLGKWRVEEMTGAPSGKRVLRLYETKNSGVTFNLCMSEATFPADLDLAVRLHANSGSEDQGGGLIWRAKDADNYYLARWNPLEDNLRAYKVVGGRRSMFQSVELKADATQWHALRIRAKGKSVEVSFDGTARISFEDDTFGQPGKVGVWTKADAASSFDDLEVNGKR
jgi:hypothetical protein